MFNVRFPLLLSCAILLFLAHAFFLRCVAEDSFITFRFAENLAGGHGFVWNIGEAPVEGFTNFLWVVLCAGAIKTGLDVIVFAQVAGIVAGAATMGCAYCFAVRAMDSSRAGAVAACFLIACFGPFATWAASGMETVPFALFVLVGTYKLLRFHQEQRMHHGIVGALSMLAAALLRPEGVMAAAVVCGLCWILWDRSSGRSRIYALLPSVLFGALFGVYFLWRYRYFGFLLPNTFYAKTGGGLPQQLRGLKYALDFAVFYLVPILPVVVLAAWECVPALWVHSGTCMADIRTTVPQGRSHLRMGPTTDTAGGDPIRRWDLRGSMSASLVASVSRLHSALMVCVVLIVVYAAYIVYVGGDYMAMYRFWVPLVPLICLMFGRMTSSVLAASSGSVRRKGLAYSLLLLTCLATLWPSTPLEAVVLRKPKYHHGRFQGVYRERWHTARLTAIGKFFRQYRKDYSETLATDAIGAIGYYSDMKILGMHGLVDTHIAHLKTGRSKLGTGLPGHEKGDMAYIFSREPAYIMFGRALSREPFPWPTFGPELDPLVRAAYELRSEWLTDVVNGEEGYFTFLERRL